MQALKGHGKVDKALLPRLPKMPALAEHQFFDTGRLQELFEKEHALDAVKQHLAQRET